MTHLMKRHVVLCPYHRAQRYLADRVAASAASGAPRSLKLTLSGPGFELTKDVTVTFGPAADPMHMEQPWHIHWKPVAGPYPEFDGELTVRADETYESALLELQGGYRPPGGALGEAFDWAAGSRIAGATAEALLERIGSEMESRYQHEEQSKHTAAGG